MILLVTHLQHPQSAISLYWISLVYFNDFTGQAPTSDCAKEGIYDFTGQVFLASSWAGVLWLPAFCEHRRT